MNKLMSKKLLLIFLLLIPFNLIGERGEYASQDTDYSVQSMFLYNFAGMVNWPSAYQSGEFIIAVYGNNPMAEEIQDMAQRRNVGGRQIEAKTFNSINEISKCHIIYVPSGQSRNLSDVVDHLKANNISALIVSDSRRALRDGAVINFIIRQGRQRFQVSEENARTMGVDLSGEIIRLGI